MIYLKLVTLPTANWLWSHGRWLSKEGLDGLENTEDNWPDVFNPNQADSDGDGVGDACETADTTVSQGSTATAVRGGASDDKLVGTGNRDALFGKAGKE